MLLLWDDDGGGGGPADTPDVDLKAFISLCSLSVLCFVCLCVCVFLCLLFHNYVWVCGELLGRFGLKNLVCLSATLSPSLSQLVLADRLTD